MRPHGLVSSKDRMHQVRFCADAINAPDQWSASTDKCADCGEEPMQSTVATGTLAAS